MLFQIALSKVDNHEKLWYTICQIQALDNFFKII